MARAVERGLSSASMAASFRRIPESRESKFSTARLS